jgi:uncharacterized membrane protein YhhN
MTARASGTRGWARLLGKSLLMPAVASPLSRASAAPRGRVLTAQACSWVGDIALVGRGRAPFLVGLGSFLAAHLAYISAYRQRSSAPVLASGGRRRLILAGTAASLGMAIVARRRDRALTVPVAAYGVALVAMVATAAAIDADRGRARVLSGAWLFLVSDSLIGVRRFLADDEGRALEAAIMTSYATGQWLISDGMRRG